MINIPITFHSDDKGYFDRECPNELCLYKFKINMGDWKEKVSDEAVYCPLCGHVDTSDKWWTQEQIESAKKVALSWAESYVQGELDKSLKKLEASTRGNKFIKITYRPAQKTTFINNPLGQSPEWEKDIICPECETRYSVIGLAYFCPACGYNTIKDTIEQSLDSIENMITSLPDMENFLSESYGKDGAKAICQTMLDGSLGDVVSAYQKIAEIIYKDLSGKNVRANDFQIVDKGSNLFKELIGKGYDSWINENEINFMKLMFQRRHIMEHNGGIVDQQYIQNSGDISYKLGQRLVLRDNDVEHLILIVRKLTYSLRKLL